MFMSFEKKVMELKERLNPLNGSICMFIIHRNKIREAKPMSQSPQRVNMYVYKKIKEEKDIEISFESQSPQRVNMYVYYPKVERSKNVWQ